MIVTLDTNVLIAAFISRGQCHELVEHLVRHHTIVSSAFILQEFKDKLRLKFSIAASDVEAAMTLLQSRMVVVEPQRLSQPVVRDSDDDWILATALAGKSACIVTGDKDLLSLEQHEGIVILRPAEFWAYEARAEGKNR